MPPVAEGATKGCWTCKERKIRCDGTRPVCRRCIRSSRECGGYELRLSWPRQNDAKRMLATQVFTPPHGWSKTTSGQFINVSSGDIELHLQLSSHQKLQGATGGVSWSPPLLMQPHREVSHMGLMEYFISVAYCQLVTFNQRSSEIRDALMRLVCYGGDGASGRGLLFALMAFSSLHGGSPKHAAQFKMLALGALSTSSRDFSQAENITEADAMFHVAACMLLCSYELLDRSHSSGEWLHYITGAMSIVYGAQPDKQSDWQNERQIILEWFYYHYALSRFATRHWNHKKVNLGGTETPMCRFQQAKLNNIAKSPLPTHEVLSLFSEVCETLSERQNFRSNRSRNDDQINALEERLRGFSLASAASIASVAITDTAEVYRIATLIYLKRASPNPSDLLAVPPSGSPSSLPPSPGPASIDELIDAIFTGHVEMSSSCSQMFPLLMIACEARTDERRASILRCVERTESAQNRDLSRIKAEIKAMWIQQDLYADLELVKGYGSLLSAVISSHRSLPSYV